MKNYIERLKQECPPRRFVFWWIFRLLMVYSFFATLFEEPFVVTRPMVAVANLACMFVWEAFMALPKNNVLRYTPSVLQDYIVIGVFAAAFVGNFMNLYYSFRWWDSALHLIGSAVAVFFGYEFACALIKKAKKDAPMSMVLFTAVGFAFIGVTLWELFEFAMDQVSGMISGLPADAQHWSIEAALGTPKVQTLFDPIVADRWPLMDTMGDMVLNTVGTLAAYVCLKIYPYRHKGKFKFDFNFQKEPSGVA